MRAEVEIEPPIGLLFTPSYAAYTNRNASWQIFVQIHDGEACELLNIVEAGDHPDADEVMPESEPGGILEHFIGLHFLVRFGDGAERCLHYSNFTRPFCA